MQSADRIYIILFCTISSQVTCYFFGALHDMVAGDAIATLAISSILCCFSLSEMVQNKIIPHDN